MKLTKSQLKQIIQEELRNILTEQGSRYGLNPERGTSGQQGGSSETGHVVECGDVTLPQPIINSYRRLVSVYGKSQEFADEFLKVYCTQRKKVGDMEAGKLAVKWLRDQGVN